VHSATEPQVVYDIDGQRWVKDAPGFADAIVWAHEERLRPRCLCQPDSDGQGIEMYVARLMDGFIVKRMPNTGSDHAPTCPSYEPPAEFSGVGQLLGSAIVENPATGETTLKLDFSLTKLPGRSTQSAAGSDSSSVSSKYHRLGLRGLLHYLWDQSELTHWKPSFTGRRTWATVRKHLLRAAENKVARGQPLLASLYVPEVFSVEQRGVIQARRQRHWSRAMPKLGQPQPLMLIVAEVKEIAPTRYGHKALLKHLPDQAFPLDEPLFRRLARGFERELSLWGTEADTHLIMIATFRMDDAGTPAISELSLMLATAQWLPVEDAWERQLVNALVKTGRRFIKGLRYNAAPDRELVTASLLDCGAEPHLLFIACALSPGETLAPDCRALPACENAIAWWWHPADGDMPTLPLLQARGLAFPLP
jgi:hypothetical protein